MSLDSMGDLLMVAPRSAEDASGPQPPEREADGGNLWHEELKRRRRLALELDGGWRGRLKTVALAVLVILVLILWFVVWFGLEWMMA